MKRILLSLMTMLCFVGTMNAQSNVNWKVVAPEDGGQYYIYNLAQKKYLNDADGWDETASVKWTFSGTTESFTLTSENSKQFAMYREWVWSWSDLGYHYYVTTSATGKSGSDIQLKSDRYDEGKTYVPSFSIYRDSKTDNWSGNRNVQATSTGLEIVEDAEPEFVFVSIEQYKEYEAVEEEIEEMGEETRSTPFGGFGTICLPYDFASIDAAIFSVTGFDENNVTLTLDQVDAADAGKPYIYQATNENGQTFERIENGNIAVEASEDNYLVGLFKYGIVPANNYVLQCQNNVYGFYKTTTDRENVNYRSYLKGSAAPASSSVKGFGFAEPSATAIKAVSDLTSDNVEAVYGANGARQNGLQKGMNIVKMSDGSVQKVLVK